MRILGLDPGSRIIGAAVSGGKGQGVVELGSYPNNRNFWPMISKICHAEKIGLIVVGHPRQLDGSLTVQSREAEEFASRLRKETGVEVTLEDESATSAEAEERLRAIKLNREEIDERIHATAAAVILEGYLASHPS
jgi:putative Holliday junction resolvase